MKAISTFILSTLVSGIICAQSDVDFVKFIKGASLVSENDVFLPIDNWDQNYTGQFRLDIFTKGILDKGFGFPFPRNRQQSHNNLQSIFVNGMGYTPARRYFPVPSPVTNDRPFAAFVCYGYQRTAAWNTAKIGKHKIGRIAWGTEIALGKMGSNAGKNVQNFIHEYITVGSAPVLGWGNQIAHPGRFTWYLRENFSWYTNNQIRIKKRPRNLYYGARLEVITGTFMSYVKVGPSISNRNDILLPMITVPSAQRNFNVNFEFYPSIKYVHWNSTLSGHPIDDNSVHKIPRAEVNKFVPEMALRINFIFNDMIDERLFTIYYAANWRGKEFKAGTASHLFGSVGIRTLKLN